MIDHKKLGQIAAEWDGCTKCEIGKFARKHVHYRIVVQGEGANCDVLFVGEGPGVVEDVRGEPFVGDSGKLLGDAIEEATDSVDRRIEPNECGLTYAFINLVACRPCDRKGGPNRQPTDEEIRNCESHLTQLVEALDPRIVVLTGKIAQTKAPFFPERETRRLPHPAYIIYRGGRSSEDYKRYVDRLTEIFEFAWELKEEQRNG